MKTARNLSTIVLLSLAMFASTLSMKAEGEDSFVKVESQDLSAWKNADQRTTGNMPSLLPGQKVILNNEVSTPIVTEVSNSIQETTTLNTDLSAVQIVNNSK